jgi:hypothetical protein
MKSLIGVAMLSMALATEAAAQTADFKCPAVGTQFSYKAGDIERVSTATGQDGNVCLFSSTSAGKTEALRVHWGLIGSVDPQGEAFAGGLDMKSLWPLKVGNKITNAVTVRRDGKSYTSTVTMTVAAYEKVTVPAGTFDAFRVEEVKQGTTARNIHWWAPVLANSAKERFPDWHDLTKVVVLELTAVKSSAK